MKIRRPRHLRVWRSKLRILQMPLCGGVVSDRRTNDLEEVTCLRCLYAIWKPVDKSSTSD